MKLDVIFFPDLNGMVVFELRIGNRPSYFFSDKRFIGMVMIYGIKALAFPFRSNSVQHQVNILIKQIGLQQIEPPERKKMSLGFL